MAIAVHSAAGRYALLALMIFTIVTILRFSFPISRALSDLQDFHGHGPEEHAPGLPPSPPEPVVKAPPAPGSEKPLQSPAGGGFEDIQNSTLGFQKVYVLSMPGRGDKRDLMALAADMSGIQIEFVDGVNGSNVPIVARPDGWENVFSIDRGNPDGNLGCWRGHMDIYQKMLQENIQSAFVIEDDVDWDVTIRAQMTEVARGSKQLSHTKDKPSHSPYGDNWYLISTGNCAIMDNLKGDQERWVIENDPTVVPQIHRHLIFGPHTRPEVLAGPHTRMMFDMRAVLCTGSYGITLQGARSVIYDQAVLSNARTIDFALSNLCVGPLAGKCLGIYPPVTGIYVPAGDRAKESDRLDHPGRNEFSWSLHIVYSVRLNLARLLGGEKIMGSQYPEETMEKELVQTTFVYPSGKLVTIPGAEYEEAHRIEEQRLKENEDRMASRKENFRKAAEEKKRKEEEEKKRKEEEEKKKKEDEKKLTVGQ